MDAYTEVRIALVLNGGVSLAVWMGGVVHEVDLLRRASADVLPPPDGSPDRPVYDAWRDLCQRHRVRVVVDVVAGTSAGGLNGTLLATAVARGAALPDLQAVWRDTAQLSTGKLVPPDGVDALPSVLDGDFFSRSVAKVVEGIAPGPDRRPVTLFVTATALGRHERTVVDSYGSTFPVPDHRRLYRFRYDPSARRVRARAADGLPAADVTALFPLDPQDDFGPEDTPRLVRGARASAGFPLAFAPVREADDEVDLRERRVRGSGAAWLVDGGILDNAPFDPVLDEIAGRPVDRPWKRVLAYVVPSGAAPPPAVSSGSRPGWVPVLSAALRLPAEADLRGDVERLMELGQRSGQWAQQPQDLFRALRDGSAGPGLVEAARALLPAYRQQRVDSGVSSALWLWAQVGASHPVCLSAAGAADPDSAGAWVPPADWAVASTSPPFSWGTAVADRVARLLLRDLAGRVARGEVTRPEAALSRLSDVISCTSALRADVERLITTASPGVPTVPRAVHACDEATRATRSPELLDALLRDGARAWLGAVDPAGDEDAVLRDALVVEVLTRAYAAGSRFQRSVGFDVVHLGPDVESPVVPAAVAQDEVAPRPLGAWKLWGTQLGHFGAFGRAEWRTQDWLWGRLDGVAHLARVLHSCGGDPDDEHDVDEDVAGLQTRVLESAGETAEQVGDRLAVLLRQDGRSVLRELRSTGRGRDETANAVSALLRTLRSSGGGTPPPVTKAGGWLSVVLAEQLPQDLRDEFAEDVAHFASSRLRRRFWRAVRGEP